MPGTSEFWNPFQPEASSQQAVSKQGSLFPSCSLSSYSCHHPGSLTRHLCACLSTLCTGQGAWSKTRPRSNLHSTRPAMNPSTRLRPQRRCLLLVSAKGPSGLVGTPPSNKLGLGCPQRVLSTTKSHTQQQAHTASVLTNMPTSGLQRWVFPGLTEGPLGPHSWQPLNTEPKTLCLPLPTGLCTTSPNACSTSPTLPSKYTIPVQAPLKWISIISGAFHLGAPCSLACFFTSAFGGILAPYKVALENRDLENEAGSGKQKGRASTEREERRRKGQRPRDTAISSQAQESLRCSPILAKCLFHPKVGTGLAGWPGLW